MKKLFAVLIPLTFAIACGVAQEEQQQDVVEDLGTTSQDLTVSCKADYHPVAWCSGSMGYAECRHDFNKNIRYGRRSVNCGAQDRLCRDYGASVQCVRP